MNEIFGVMQHDRIEANIVFFLEEQHPLIDPVQAVCFGGGPGMGAGSKMDIAIRFRQVSSRPHSRLIVWIRAEKKIEIAIADRRKIVANHVPNDPSFLPARHENCKPAFFFEKVANAK